jgi:hypothetical protein
MNKEVIKSSFYWYLFCTGLGCGIILTSNELKYQHIKNKKYQYFIPYGLFNGSAKTVLIKDNQMVDDKHDIQNAYYAYISKNISRAKEKEMLNKNLEENKNSYEENNMLNMLNNQTSNNFKKF